ncbi:MAG: hypothetical protein Q9162_002080 [Coniocarpon cinnabarinum]
MAHFMRGKQAGVQGDFSANIQPDLFAIDDLRRLGVSSRVTKVAFDPVQSLFAVGTESSVYGPGQIYVFGRNRISCTLPLPSPKATVKDIQFCSDRLVCLDTQNDINVFSLPERKRTGSYSPPGGVLCIATDSTLDYAMLGMANGEILAYDLDRMALAPFRLPCLWAEQNARAKSMPIINLQFHPRDIGKLLVGYAEGAVIYSFKKNESRIPLHYQLAQGAPGGDANPTMMNTHRSPRLTQALWHPTGTFVLTAHEDSSIVIWDPKEGRIISARSLTDVDVNVPGSAKPQEPGRFVPRTPIINIAWCCKNDPDDTALLFAGGTSAAEPSKGLTFLELGRTPNYATSSWQMFSEHFNNPKKQRILPTPPGAEVTDFCLLPRMSPWFNGAQDPIALLALTSGGEITTMSFPSGFPVSPTNQLNLSMTFIHPFITHVDHATIDRARWLGLTEKRQSGPKLLVGGAEASHPLKRFESRSIVLAAHADGTARAWDVGHGDEVENDLVLEADVCRAVGRHDNVNITKLGMSGASGELAAGLQSGELIIFKWQTNRNVGIEPDAPRPCPTRQLISISDRKDPSLSEGFHAFSLLDQQDGPVTAVKVSDVGFIAAGFHGGSVILIDMRGPAVILDAHVNDFGVKERGAFRRSRSNSIKQGYVTCLEFSVMSLEGDPYSSILLHMGTNMGSLINLKVLPAQGGRYEAKAAGSVNLDNSVISICPMNATNGKPAFATQEAVAALRNGARIDGVILAASKSDARIFPPPTSKGAHKEWDGGVQCKAFAVTQVADQGMAAVGMFSDNSVRGFTLPGLREMRSERVGGVFDRTRLGDAIVTQSGDVLGWAGPSELALLNFWGAGLNETESNDRIFNPEALIPPRPTISNFQWVSGTQYMTAADLNLLIGGPDRPPSKRQLEQSRADEAARRADQRAAVDQSADGMRDGSSQEGYWAWASRNLSERTEKLNIMGDSMDNLQKNSSGFADDVSKFVDKQKRNLVMGAVRSKFGM